MNMKQIEGFCYLAQTLNFSKSSEMMYISQPAFSRMISSLEEELGCQLFVRSKTEPRLTAVGEQLLSKALEINRIRKEMKTIVDNFNQDEQADLRIGLLDNGMFFLKEMISKYHEKYPGIRLDIREFSEMDICRVLTQGVIDTAFIFHYPNVYRNDTDGVLIEETPECIVVKADHPLASKKSVALTELRSEPFVMVRKERSVMGYDHIMGELLNNGINPNIVMNTDSLTSALAAVECGFGITILSKSLEEVNGANDRLRFIPIDSNMKGSLWMIWKKGYLDQKINDLLEMAKTNISSDVCK